MQAQLMGGMYLIQHFQGAATIQGQQPTVYEDGVQLTKYSMSANDISIEQG